MWQYKFLIYIYMYIDEISFCTIYIIMYSILVKQFMRIKNLELRLSIFCTKRCENLANLITSDNKPP